MVFTTHSRKQKKFVIIYISLVVVENYQAIKPVKIDNNLLSAVTLISSFHHFNEGYCRVITNNNVRKQINFFL
jgi:hypothetical protein